MNHLENLNKLNNRYFGMRHGEAESNEQGIIISDPAVGLVSYPLTEKGRAMVAGSVKKSDLTKDVLIICSDFLRTKQTAEIAKEILGVERVVFDPRLRERFFGDYEGGNDNQYVDIWDVDHKNPSSEVHHVEPAEHLMDRVTSVILDLEAAYNGKTILLVSHGDPLQFLETAFARIPIYEHLKYPLFDLAEIKELKFRK